MPPGCEPERAGPYGRADPTKEATWPPRSLDGDKLMAFVFHAVDEVGATLNAALVVMGDARPVPGDGRRRPALARRAGRAHRRPERYVREWLNAQAAGGYVEYDPETRPLHAAARADRGADRQRQPGVPAGVLPDRDRRRSSTRRGSPTRRRAARASAGTSTTTHVFEGCERFFRPGYNANLVAEWLPALDGVVEKLERGARVADVGCGHGSSTILMAQAFPNSTFVGSDYHAGSIETARRSAPRRRA